MDVWDTVLQCFGVRVSPGGRKTWFVIVRVGGRQKRVTIGTHPALSLAEARGAARKRIRDAQLGLLNVSTESPALTLGETIPLFIELYAKPKNRGWKESAEEFRKPIDMTDEELDAAIERTQALIRAAEREEKKNSGASKPN
jgi:Arm domain-containing DNA-binding protein